MRWSAVRATVLLTALLWAGARGAEERHPNDAGPYVPTPAAIVDAMLKLAEVRSEDVVYDLGSGDGRLVITSAKRYGARGVGIDLQRRLVEVARENARKEGVADRVRFVEGDLFEADIREASVVTLYLLPQFVVRLVPRFRAELRPGTRIVSHDFPLLPWQPDRVLEMDVEEKEWIAGTAWTKLYYYVVPARVAGVWQLELPPSLGFGPLTLGFVQSPASLGGVLWESGNRQALSGLKVEGEHIRFAFTLADRTLEAEGSVSGTSMSGQVRGGTSRGPWTAHYQGPLSPR